MTYVVALVLRCGGFLWGGLEYWRRGQNGIAAASLVVACITILGAATLRQSGHHPEKRPSLPTFNRGLPEPIDPARS